MGEGHQNHVPNSHLARAHQHVSQYPKGLHIVGNRRPSPQITGSGSSGSHRAQTQGGAGTRALVTFKDADLELDNDPRHRTRCKLWMQSIKTWTMMMVMMMI